MWVVKLKDGYYSLVGSHSCRSQKQATRFESRSEALIDAGRFEDQFHARIVRLKPRAKLDEAAIRLAERKRIVAAFREEPVPHTHINRVFFNDRNMSGSTVSEVRSAILEFDWKPGP